ncbi:MAG: hypothetical protein M1825_001747 [Sarcosagium campestre]|nr:MAG: hypothetical protein M1825_001747 [Sarcosagium campestre]
MTAPRRDFTFQRKVLSAVMEPDTEDDFGLPAHPISGMQGAFEESMAETSLGAEKRLSKYRGGIKDSVTRRRVLLEQEVDEETHASQWGQKEGEQYHPIWKLVAQISFGMHLLQQGLAKSDHEVIKILQTHVNEIDEFLEVTTDDFDLALNDIDERIVCLQLPLDHAEVFDVMLEDRVFRGQIVDGNEKIEHIINRTAAAMHDALQDIQQGLDATKELGRYLMKLDVHWSKRSADQEDVFAAMTGNVEGWVHCFVSLLSKADSLSAMMLHLGGVVEELQRRAGVASRKNIAALINRGRTTSPDPRKVPGRLQATPSQRQMQGSALAALSQKSPLGVLRRGSSRKKLSFKTARFKSDESLVSEPSAAPSYNPRPERAPYKISSITNGTIQGSNSTSRLPRSEEERVAPLPRLVEPKPEPLPAPQRRGSLPFRQKLTQEFRRFTPPRRTVTFNSLNPSPKDSSTSLSRDGNATDSAYSSAGSETIKPPSSLSLADSHSTTGDVPTKWSSNLLSSKAAAVMGTYDPPPRRRSMAGNRSATGGGSSNSSAFGGNDSGDRSGMLSPGPNRRNKPGFNLKSSFSNMAKRTFERESILLQILYGGGQGPRGDKFPITLPETSLTLMLVQRAEEAKEPSGAEAGTHRIVQSLPEHIWKTLLLPTVAGAKSSLAPTVKHTSESFDAGVESTPLMSEFTLRSPRVRCHQRT